MVDGQGTPVGGVSPQRASGPDVSSAPEQGRTSGSTPGSTSGSTSRAPGDDLVCSARDCRAAATWGLRWNNPRLHPPERRKTWLACDEHRERLATHLDVRGFLREVVPAGALDGGRS